MIKMVVPCGVAANNMNERWSCKYLMAERLSNAIGFSETIRKAGNNLPAE